MNWYKQNLKTSAKITDIQSLQAWNQTNSSDYAYVDNDQLSVLRNILGTIYTHCPA